MKPQDLQAGWRKDEAWRPPWRHPRRLQWLKKAPGRSPDSRGISSRPSGLLAVALPWDDSLAYRCGGSRGFAPRSRTPGSRTNDKRSGQNPKVMKYMQKRVLLLDLARNLKDSGARWTPSSAPWRRKWRSSSRYASAC